MLTSVKGMERLFHNFYKGGNSRKQNESIQNMEYVKMPEFCRQKLLQYADSFQDLARSLDIEDMNHDIQEEEEMSQEDIGQEESNMLSEEETRCNVLDERWILENRMLIGYHFREMANIMTRLADELTRCKPMEEHFQRQLRHALRTESIFADYFCYFLDKCQNNHAIGMTLYTEKREGFSASDVANMLSVLLDRRLQLSAVSPYRIDEIPRNFVFVDETSYVVLTGFCKVKKQGQQVSGDHYSILESEKGHITLLLSDGTGSGDDASRDSEKALDLMEKFLEAGYDTTAAAAMVNVAFYAGERELCHPTLDLCELNLYDGSCSFLKIGGAVSFLKHGDNVEQIQQGALPLGIFRNPDMEKVERQLQSGDYVILVTDGVLDALPEENYLEVMEQMIVHMSEIGPEEIAEKLMELVLRTCEGHVMDDMTVLVAGIWENTVV